MLIYSLLLVVYFAMVFWFNLVSLLGLRCWMVVLFAGNCVIDVVDCSLVLCLVEFCCVGCLHAVVRLLLFGCGVWLVLLSSCYLWFVVTCFEFGFVMRFGVVFLVLCGCCLARYAVGADSGLDGMSGLWVLCWLFGC